jgi:stalled ribosome rescue protein Dom34
VLTDPKVAERMINTKAINQNKVLEKFYDLMKKNESLVSYG